MEYWEENKVADFCFQSNLPPTPVHLKNENQIEGRLLIDIEYIYVWQTDPCRTLLTPHWRLCREWLLHLRTVIVRQLTTTRNLDTPISSTPWMAARSSPATTRVTSMLGVTVRPSEGRNNLQIAIFLYFIKTMRLANLPNINKWILIWSEFCKSYEVDLIIFITKISKRDEHLRFITDNTYLCSMIVETCCFATYMAKKTPGLPHLSGELKLPEWRVNK